jgi:hypothetical protein
VDRLGAFFDIIHQDPVLSQVKLIAEPWDLGEGGYQVGNFPVLWAEWNAEYRDTVRRFWKGDGGLVGGLALRLTGSSDLYGRGGRRPYASINFVTAHDGFTLADVVSYNEKHNEANGEENRDGHNENLSWNCGAEGTPTTRNLALRASSAILGHVDPLARFRCCWQREIGRTRGAIITPGERNLLDGLEARSSAELLHHPIVNRLFHQHPFSGASIFRTWNSRFEVKDQPGLTG